MPTPSPQDLIEQVRLQAERSGAAEADVFVESATVLEVRTRQREVEVVQQSAPRGLGLRVFRDRRMGFAYTTDLRKVVLDELVNRTVALSNQATPHDENRLATQLFSPQQGLETEDAAIAQVSIEDLKAMATTAEDGAFGQDQRIQSTRDARAGVATVEVHLGNTVNPYQTYRSTTAWLSVTAIATQGGQRREGEYIDRKRILRDLDTPEHVGRRAAERAVAKLGAAARPTMKGVVVFDAEASGAFLAGLFGAFDAANVLEKRSYLASRQGQAIASPLLTIIDDGLMRRGLGTTPFDGDGVGCRRTVVVDRGVLTSYLHTAITAWRMNVPPTGNAVRAYDALPTVGPTNFYIDQGRTDPDEMVQGVPRGLLVTGTAGFGFDLVSGEYSQQVEGVWILNGQPAGAAEGITVAGRLDDMLLGIDAVGNHLEFHDRIASPALRFRELTIAGL